MRKNNHIYTIENKKDQPWLKTENRRPLLLVTDDYEDEFDFINKYLEFINKRLEFIKQNLEFINQSLGFINMYP